MRRRDPRAEGEAGMTDDELLAKVREAIERISPDSTTIAAAEAIRIVREADEAHQTWQELTAANMRLLKERDEALEKYECEVKCADALAEENKRLREALQRWT
jgi:plasmid maintenance system antidote protein VapI